MLTLRFIDTINIKCLRERYNLDLKKRWGALRGWIPKEPAIGIKSAEINLKPWQVTLPFFASAALMIVAAGLSAYIGFTLLQNTQVAVGARNFETAYWNIYTGALNLASFGLGLFAAMLLLLRKYVALAEILAGIMLACGLAAPWIVMYFHSPLIYMYWWTFPLQNLLVSLPMIVFSLATLIMVRLNRKKLKLDFNRRWTLFPFTVSGILMIIASVPLAYNVSYLLWLLWFSGSALSSNVAVYLEVLLYLALFGLDLFIASLFLRRKRVGAAAVIVAVMLAVGLPLQLFLLKGVAMPFYVFDFPTVACLLATLILVGLNYRNLKQAKNNQNVTKNLGFPRKGL